MTCSQRCRQNDPTTSPYGQCTARMHGRIGRRHVGGVIRGVENDVLNVMAMHSPTTFVLYIDCMEKLSDRLVGVSVNALSKSEYF